MRRYVMILILLTTLPFALSAKGKSIMQRNKAYTEADSIVNEVMKFAENYWVYIKSYDGKNYIKGDIQIEKVNKIAKWLPKTFPYSKSDKDSFFEIANEISYLYPNELAISTIALNAKGTYPLKNLSEISPLLNLNVYSATSFQNRFIMPCSSKSVGIYEYRLDSILNKGDEEWYKIRYLPIRNNPKLLSGYLYIKKGTCIIRKLEGAGQLDIAKFTISTTFGLTKSDFMLPIQSDISIRYNLLGNVAQVNYQCYIKYSNIKILHEELPARSSLDQTRYFSIRKGDLLQTNDSTFWHAFRKSIEYANYDERESPYNTIDVVNTQQIAQDTIKKLDYLKLSEKLITYSSYTTGSIRWRYSGLANPAMIGYSKTNGISIRQQLLLRKTFTNEKELHLRPEIGFSFKTKEVFYRFKTNWAYKPNRLGTVSLLFNNGTRTFSSAFIEDINNQLDSTGYKFDNLSVPYYRDYHVQGENAYELYNGLMLYAGVSYNYRKPLKVKSSTEEEIPDNKDLIKESYSNFMPYLRLSFTPRQRYRFEGYRKIYIPTNYPTLTTEYSKGIYDVLSSSSRFDRAEFDIHHTIPLSRLRSFSYRAGVGAFFNQQSEYFVTFRYFTPRNYPDSWSDGIGGTFNLLDRHWYFASPSYLQFHFMYESPFMLLHFFRRISRYILTERLYAGQLYTPAKPSYTEFGYGLGNYIFNVAIFSSLHKAKFHEIGFRITFELDKYW